MDAPQVDVDEAIDALPRVLRSPFRRFIKEMMKKSGLPRDEKDDDKADKEREALVDLHEETSGKPTPIEVTKDDLPPELSDDSEDEMDEEEDETEDAKPAQKKKGK